MKITVAEDFYFWSTHGGAKLDLLLFKNGKRFGFEFKCNDAPRITKSIKIAKQDLNLDKIFIIYPGIKPQTDGREGLNTKGRSALFR